MRGRGAAGQASPAPQPSAPGVTAPRGKATHSLPTDPLTTVGTTPTVLQVAEVLVSKPSLGPQSLTAKALMSPYTPRTKASKVSA